MRLYVGRSSFSVNPKDDALVQREIERLAAQAVKDKSQLQERLSWLVTGGAGQGFAFGFALGKRDEGFSLLPEILEAQRSATENSSGFFLGGYLRSVSEAEPALLDDTLDTVAKDRNLTPLLVELTWRTRVTDHSVKRLISAARKGLIEISDLRTLAFGRAINNLSEAVFNEFARYLISLERSDAGLRIPRSIRVLLSAWLGKRACSFPRKRHLHFYRSLLSFERRSIRLRIPWSPFTGGRLRPRS